MPSALSRLRKAEAMGMEFRWLENEEILEKVNPALEGRGQAPLNVNEAQPTCRVLGAFWGGVLVEIFALQMFPVLGPLIKVNEGFRDNGDTARTLSALMTAFLREVQARGWLVICDEPFSERLSQRHGLVKIESPVYLGSSYEGVRRV